MNTLGYSVVKFSRNIFLIKARYPALGQVCKFVLSVKSFIGLAPGHRRFSIPNRFQINHYIKGNTFFVTKRNFFLVRAVGMAKKSFFLIFFSTYKNFEKKISIWRWPPLKKLEMPHFCKTYENLKLRFLVAKKFKNLPHLQLAC